MAKRVYGTDSTKLDSLLDTLSLETGKSKEQLIREALEAFSFYEPPDDELVLDPKEGVADKKCICDTLDNQFNMRKSIKKNNDCSRMVIVFLSGQELVINSESTWGEIKTKLNLAFA